MDSTIEHLTDATFADAVTDGLTVIDFWAAWCGPCRAMAPQFERAAQLRPQYRFAKVDVDAEPELASRYACRVRASRSRATGTPRSSRPARQEARTGWSRPPTR
jgi:thiol-disulfide isomerase/thioredoxin